MKQGTRLCFALLGFSMLAACGTKNSGTFAARYANGKSLQQKTTTTCTALPAGDVSVGGVLVTTKEDKSSALVDRVSVVSTNATSSFKTLATPLAATTDALTTAAAAKTYINLGCQADVDLPTDIAKNWSEVKIATASSNSATCSQNQSLTVSANTIYVCGSQKISQSALLLLADHLIFKKDATLALADTENGSLSVVVNTLTLAGNNSIAVKSKDSSSFTAGSSVTLDVNVLKNFEDSGKLILSSSAGKCLGVVAPSPKASPSPAFKSSFNNASNAEDTTL